MTPSSTHLRPTDEAEAAAMIADARARKIPLMLQGGNTRSGLGRPAQAETTLSTAALTGITLHEPAELVISARAGTPLQEVERRLAEHGQYLPFEPMDHRTLFGTSGEPTIGAVAAGNISGPRRLAAGAARDHLIGVRLVNGRGEVIKSGGRVMKNVTGLDLVKLSCGAYGTLGLLTEVTFKVLPVPRHAATLVLDGLDDATALQALSSGLGAPFEVSGACHLPAGIGTPVARTCLRLEGLESSVAARALSLGARLVRFGAPSRLNGPVSSALWAEVRDCAFLAELPERAVWRVHVAAPRGAEVMAQLHGTRVRHYYDWGGGLIWISAPADASAVEIRAAAAASGGYATLVRAGPDIRATTSVFAPLAGPLMKLTSGIKESFDPDRILNPGRMYAGV